MLSKGDDPTITLRPGGEVSQFRTMSHKYTYAYLIISVYYSVCIYIYTVIYSLYSDPLSTDSIDIRYNNNNYIYNIIMSTLD